MATNPADSNVHEVGRADIEIVERRRAKDGFSLVVPNGFRINGVEIPIPQDARIKVHEITSGEPVAVTVTLFASSVTIRTEPDNRP